MLVVCATNLGVGDTSWSTGINFPGMSCKVFAFHSTIGFSLRLNLIVFANMQALHVGNGQFESCCGMKFSLLL